VLEPISKLLNSALLKVFQWYVAYCLRTEQMGIKYPFMILTIPFIFLLSLFALFTTLLCLVTGIVGMPRCFKREFIDERPHCDEIESELESETETESESETKTQD
jgi:hypothetical protein